MNAVNRNESTVGLVDGDLTLLALGLGGWLLQRFARNHATTKFQETICGANCYTVY